MQRGRRREVQRKPMIRTILPDMPTLLLAAAFYILILAVKLAIVHWYDRRFRPRARFLTTVSLIFNLGMVSGLLFVFLNPALHRSYDTIPLIAGPLFWLLEGTVYYFLAELRPVPAIPLVVLANLAQAGLLAGAVYARDLLPV